MVNNQKIIASAALIAIIGIAGYLVWSKKSLAPIKDETASLKTYENTEYGFYHTSEFTVPTLQYLDLCAKNRLELIPKKNIKFSWNKKKLIYLDISLDDVRKFQLESLIN